MQNFFRTRRNSFQYAFQGVAYVFRTQRNSWIHLTLTVIVLLLALGLHLSIRDWAVLIVTIGLVWAAEFANTAVEALVDLVSPEIHPAAKVAKDVSAGAVLLTAITAVGVGLFLLGPPLWQYVREILKF